MNNRSWREALTKRLVRCANDRHSRDHLLRVRCALGEHIIRIEHLIATKPKSKTAATILRAHPGWLEARRRIAAFLKDYPGASIREVADHCEVPYSTAAKIRGIVYKQRGITSRPRGRPKKDTPLE